LQEVLDLITRPIGPAEIIPDLTGLSIVDIDDTMGDYDDEMY
jgi:hypothetical protein